MASAEPGAAKSNAKVSREDWLNVALDVLVSDGVDHVKVLALSQRLDVSRSSFYWYFKSRSELLDALLDHWRETNTRTFVAMCQEPAETITGAVCNLFKCFIDEQLFDHRLDFAIRDWSKRSGAVRRVVDQADAARLAEVAAMFKRYGFAPEDAEIRARILYYMQIGYFALELRETAEERLALVPGYLKGFTGLEPRPEEITGFIAFARRARDAEAQAEKTLRRPESDE